MTTDSPTFSKPVEVASLADLRSQHVWLLRQSDAPNLDSEAFATHVREFLESGSELGSLLALPNERLEVNDLVPVT